MIPVSIRKTRKILRKMDHVLILMHENPDMDSIGTAYALALDFNHRGKVVKIGIEKPLNPRYTFFFEAGDLEKYFVLRENLKKTDVQNVVCVDTASKALLGEFEPFLRTKQVLVIDHHKVFEPYGDAYLCQGWRSSAAEIMLEILKIKRLTPLIAQSLYAGMIYDTGNFKYDSTTPALFMMAAKLLKRYAIKTDEMAFYLFENESINRKKLVSLIVSTLETYAEGEVVVSYFLNQFKEQLAFDDSDAADLVHVGQSVKGSFFSIFIKEREDRAVSLSFRTRTAFDVSQLAQKWGGGGHQKASGLKLKNITLAEVREKIIPECLNAYLDWKKEREQSLSAKLESKTTL